MVEKNLLKQFDQENQEEIIRSLLSTPTNNFGLGLLFKKFLILTGDQQKQLVSIESYYFLNVSAPPAYVYSGVFTC